MFLSFATRGKPRAFVIVAVAGAALGLLAGGAFLAGVEAKTSEQRVRIGPLAQAAEAGYETAAKAPVPAAIAVSDRAPPPRPRLAPDNPPRPKAASPFRLVGNLGGSRDLDCLAAAVYYEARGESADGQAAVAQVVLNRARQPSFPKSVCGVVFQGAATHGCQFSFACNGAMNGAREAGAWLRARTVAARALGGYVMAAVGRATSFHAARLGGGARAITQVGGHVFFGQGRPVHDAGRQYLAEAQPSSAPAASSDASASTETPAIPATPAGAAESTSF